MNKRGCAFTIVVRPEFRMWQYRVNSIVSVGRTVWLGFEEHFFLGDFFPKAHVILIIFCHVFTQKTCQNVKPLRFRWNLRISCIEFWFDDVAETNKRFWNNNFGIYEHVMASNIHMFMLPNCHFSVLNHWRLDDSSKMQKLSFKWIKWSFAIITR